MNDNLKDKFCKLPWSFMTIGNRTVHSCCWHISKFGNVCGTGSFDIMEAWNHPNIQSLRKGVLDGTFSGCNRNTCFYILAGDLPNRKDVKKEPYWNDIMEKEKIQATELPEHIHFEADVTCNLECRMCRDVINLGKDVDIEYGKRVLWDVFEKAKSTNKYFTISMCGNGEPFMSKICRDFLFNVDLRPHPNIKIGFNTNGLLLNESTWKNMEKITKNINHINWSIEGACKETYEKCRIGGSFEKVVQNIDYINSIRKDYSFFPLLCYVVHADSYKDMAKFVRWTKERWGWKISFQKYIVNGLSNGKRLDIWNPEHPLHNDLLEELKNPIFQDPVVCMRL